MFTRAADRGRPRFSVRSGLALAGVLLLPVAVPAAPPTSADETITRLWYGPKGDTLYTTAAFPVPLGHTAPVAGVRKWDATSGRPRGSIGEFEPMHASSSVTLVAAVTRDESTFATFHSEHTPTRGRPNERAVLALWDAAGKKLAELPTAFESGATVASFSPDGTFLAVAGGCRNCAVEVFDVKRRIKVATIRGHLARRDIGASLAGRPIGVSCAVFSPDGTCLATGGGDGCVRLWSVPKFEEVACLARHADRLDAFTANDVTAVAFSPDGKTIVSAAWDGSAIVWDAVTGRALRTISVRALPKGRLDIAKLPIAVAISPDGKRLATADRDRVALWDLASGKLLAEDRHTQRAIASLTFTPGGQELVIPDQSRGLLRWEAGASSLKRITAWDRWREAWRAGWEAGVGSLKRVTTRP